MITKAIIKLMFAIANMSKKASAIYISILTFFFLAAVSFLTFGLIYYNPGGENAPEFSLPLLIVGAVILFLITATIAITTIASNYVRKNPEKDPKKKTGTEKATAEEEKKE